MIKLCIFDLDGTLINSLSDLACAMNHALEKNGYAPHETEKYRMLVGSGAAVLAQRAMNTDSPDEEAKQKILADFSEYYQSHCLDNTAPYDNINPLLDTLEEKGILYAVNSNKPDKFSNYIVSSLFPDKNFSCVIGKRDGFERKPAPDGIHEIQRITGIPDNECMYIGDSDVDVYTAKNAGIKFCGVEWGFRGAEELKKAGASHIASNVDELLTYILNA